MTVMDLPGGGSRSRFVPAIRFLFDIAAIVVLALVVWNSTSFPQLARVFPLTAGPARPAGR